MDLTRFIALPLISLGSAFSFYGFSEYIFMFFGFSDGSLGIIVYFIIYCLTGAILTSCLSMQKNRRLLRLRCNFGIDSAAEIRYNGHGKYYCINPHVILPCPRVCRIASNSDEAIRDRRTVNTIV